MSSPRARPIGTSVRTRPAYWLKRAVESTAAKLIEVTNLPPSIHISPGTSAYTVEIQTFLISESIWEKTASGPRMTTNVCASDRFTAQFTGNRTLERG